MREQRALQRLESTTVADSAPSDDDFWSAVRELAERQRAVVALRYIEDLPIAAIADGVARIVMVSARLAVGADAAPNERREP